MTDSDAAPAVALALGRCDEMRAEVFLRVEASDDVPRCAISGTLVGPRRGRDTTLPVTARIQPTGAAGIARAILTEPAYWTPDLPNLYRLEAMVGSGDSPPRPIDRLVGLRRLGVRGRSFWLDGRRWVPRAARVEAVAGIDACKPAALSALVADPDEATLARADEIGVAILALVTGTPPDDPASVATRIAAWSAHPSAAVAILPQEFPAATVAAVAHAARASRGTLVLAATLAGSVPPPATIPPGIDALVVALDASATPHDGWRNDIGVPLVAWRRAEAPPGAGRAPCDALQAGLATWATTGKHDALPRDWAGYVVG
ncbi:MAG: hypothetical protein ACKOZU_06590 [Planctomycetaceae bacterium]